MKTAKKIGPSLSEELENRGNCRAGLPGVKVVIAGHKGLFKILSSHWDKGSRLKLIVYPAGSREPPLWKCVDPENHKFFHTACCINQDLPPGSMIDVQPEDCTLASVWPVVCCKPRRRRKVK
jgi:hypothetical protein